MGVVYHANYFIWMEIGRVELVRSRGLNYKELEHSEGLFLSVVDARCRFIFPARYDQEVVVETQMAKANARMVEFSYAIRAEASGQLLAEGHTRHIWLNRDMRPSRLPSQYHEMLYNTPTSPPG